MLTTIESFYSQLGKCNFQIRQHLVKVKTNPHLRLYCIDFLVLDGNSKVSTIDSMNSLSEMWIRL